MRSTIALFLFLFSPFAFAAPAKEIPLQFSGGAFRALVKWEKGPLSPVESALRLEWKSGADLSPAEAPGKFKVALWMPSMGHGSSPTKVNQVINEKGEPLLGVYQITRVFFTMPGKWDVKISVKYPDGGEETQSFPVVIKDGRIFSR